MATVTALPTLAASHAEREEAARALALAAEEYSPYLGDLVAATLPLIAPALDAGERADAWAEYQRRIVQLDDQKHGRDVPEAIAPEYAGRPDAAFKAAKANAAEATRALLGGAA